MHRNLVSLEKSEKKYDVLVVGELNVDLILNKIEGYPEIGKEKFARQMKLTLGSSAAIFAANLSRLGSRVAFIGKIGEDIFGDLIIHTLEKAGVDCSMIIRSASSDTGATIGLNYGNERAAFTYPGAMEQLSANDIPIAALHASRHLHCCSYFFQPALQPGLPYLLAKARELGLSTSFDMQCDPSGKWKINLESILPHIDIFLPNETELMAIGQSNQLEKAIASISSICSILVVKQGENGSLLIANKKKTHIQALKSSSFIDAIGAGDSFDAGFINQFLMNRPLTDCQRFGNIVGAISTTATGGTTALESITNIKQYVKEHFGYST
jgi:sugar/nucleoside kinase (ribokinase family)